MRYLISYSIVSFLILILIGQTTSVLGQTSSIADHVVINEVNTNPLGDDTKYPIDWVELYNPTNTAVNIGGWTIGATTGLKQIYTIPSNTVIGSKQFIVYTSGPLWFPHAGAVVQLKSPDGNIVDQTPPLTDFQGDVNSWQRIYDGYETGSSSDWVFKLATPGSSNGQQAVTTTTSPLTMTLSINKPSYIFGDTVVMSGTVSKLATDPVLGYPLAVHLLVSGPSGFQKTFNLYPDYNSQFSTSMKTDQVLGFTEGNYTISASYGTATASSAFVLGATPFTPPPQQSPIVMTISTDQSIYTISDTITLSGTVSEVIPLQPVTYKVFDPNGTTIYQGNLFPDDQGKFSTFSPYQLHASASGIMVNTISPSYGIYNVQAKYGTVTATTSFELVPKSTQNVPITLSVGKQAYAPGDTVVITGRANLQGLQNVGLSPSLEIVQTFPSGVIRGIGVNAIDIRTFVNVASDGTFSYKLNLPGTSSSLGNYRVVVTLQAQSSQEVDFVVVTNPSQYVPTTSAPLSITTDKSSYAIGDNIVISGQVTNPLSQSGSGGLSVSITIVNSTGATVLTKQNPAANIFTAVNTQDAPLVFYAYPDSNGAFQVTQAIQRGVLQPGDYTLKANYNSITASTSFSVYDPLAMGSTGSFSATTDKQVYGIGETVHLTGKIAASVGSSSSYTVTLVKPTGELISSPLVVNNGVFSWDWTIPTSSSATASSLSGTYRGSVVTVSNTQNLYGIYTIMINSDSGTSQFFFEVSQDPNKTQISPIDIETDKSEYSTTQVVKISGQVLPSTNSAAQEQNLQAQVFIYADNGQEVYRNLSNVNQGGQFHISVPLQPVIWKTGTYKLYAQYLTYSTQTTFHVTDSFTTGSGKLQVFMTTDHTKYLPGQTVLVTGRTSYIISISNAYLTFGLANDTVVNEGQVESQHGYTLDHATVGFDQYSSFTYDYKIPQNAPVGNYTIVAEVPFGVFNAYYEVVNQLPVTTVIAEGNVTSQGNVTQPIPSNATETPKEPTIIPTSIGPTQRALTSNTIVEKEGMLSGSSIPVSISEKTSGNSTYYPRELDGLLRVNPNDINSVTLKLSSQNGTCVIGPDPGCLISQSTAQGSSLYQIVKINNENFLVGYSGPGHRIQQFSLVPANANDFIPDGEWKVDIIKKDQVSRFYYQVTSITK